MAVSSLPSPRHVPTYLSGVDDVTIAGLDHFVNKPVVKL